MPQQNQHENRMESRPTAEPFVPLARPVRPGGHLLGPLWVMAPLGAPVSGRVYSAVWAALVIALFVVAARLHPDGLDHGSLQQLGLPPCGFLSMTGLPCPTCGMTTAFAYAIRGHVLQAIHAQAAGAVAAVVLLVIGVFAAIAAITGRRLAINWYRINPVHVVWVACALFVAAWGAKILLYLSAGNLASRPMY